VPALLDAAALDNREAAVFPDGRATAAELAALSSINVGTPERMRYMQDRLPTAVQISCTGSTEGAGFVCVGDPADPPEARALYAGRPVAGMEARIVDPLTGADLPDHTPGEFVFRFHSRLSDVLKVGGENVSAAEVEDEIAGLPGVSVVQVVAAPDGHYGEVAAAFVELRPGASVTEAPRLSRPAAQAESA